MVTKERAHSAFSGYMDWALANWEGKDTSSYEDRQASVDALSVLKFIEQSQPVPEWQPIKKAPRDGTLIDIYVPKFGRFTDVWWEADARPSEVQRLGHAWVHSRGIVTDGANATHWMPLPAAPNSGGES